MIKGIVRWFNDTKGFGFIDIPGAQQDIFVHYSAIQHDGFKTLCEGQIVTLEVNESPNGLIASNVKRTEDQPLVTFEEEEYEY